MAKDDNNGCGQETSNNKGHRRNERRPPTIASKAILKLGPPPTSKRTTSVKLNDAIGNEVKERLDDWRDGATFFPSWIQGALDFPKSRATLLSGSQV